MAALAKATAEEINAVRGIGPAIAEAVAGFFAEPRNRKLIQRLATLGLNMEEASHGEGGARPLAGLTFVITGTLPGISREHAAELIRAAGGHVTDSVSKQTSAVVVGANAGSKLERAKALGIPLIDEAELLRRARSTP
jgi:DNA ligase (NAD+)